MSETFGIVLAIFGLIGAGYLAQRSLYLAPPVGAGLTAYVLKIAIPLLLFQTLANADLQNVSPWRVWVAYFAPFAAVWTLSHLMVRRVFGRDARAGVVGGGSAAYANSLAIGLPLILAAFGEAGTLFLILIITAQLPVMMLVSVLLNQWALRADGMAGEAADRSAAMKRAALDLMRDPILVSIVAGILWRLSGLAVPGVAASIMEPLARTTGPISLFAAGMALAGFGAGRQIRPAFAISALKLLLMPALVFTAARLIGLPPLGVAVVTLTAACPTGVNVFLVATKLGTGQALASNALLISTAGAVVTVALWLTLLRAMLG